MSAFIVATVRVSDPAKFSAYVQAIAGLTERFGGDYVVRGAVTEVLEGESDPAERVIVSRFPDAAAARAFVASPEYRKGKALRQGAAELELRLVDVAH